MNDRVRLALLPERTEWMPLHCGEVQHCDVCLRAVANFLAREMRYDLCAALNKPTECYQADLGVDLCTTERARELRRMTVAACRPGLNAIVADFDFLPAQKQEPVVQRELKQQLKFALWWMVFLTGLLLSVA